MGGLLVASLIAGLSTGAVAKEEIVYTCWGNPFELTAEKNAIEAFSKAFPDIKVSLLHIPSRYEEKVVTMTAAGTPPDVVTWGDVHLPRLYQGLLPLDSLIKSQIDKSIYLFPEHFFKRASLEGKVYILPKRYDGIGVMVYNEKLFDEAGLGYPSEPYPRKITTEEFTQIGRKIAKDVDGDGKTDIFGSDPLFYGIVGPWFGVHNTGVVYKNGKWVCTWDSPENIAAIEFLYSAMYKEKWALPWGENRIQHFVAGRVAMLTDFGWYLKGELDKIVNFGWDLAARPGKEAPLGGIVGVGVSRYGKHTDAAWKLAKFLSTDIRGQGELQYAFAVGVTKEAAKKFLEAEHPKYLAYMVKPVGKIPEVPYLYVAPPKRLRELHSLFWNEIKTLYEGKETPESLCKRITAEANKILEEEREWGE